MKEDAEKKQEEDETKGDAGKDAPDMQGDNVVSIYLCVHVYYVCQWDTTIRHSFYTDE